MNQVHPVIDQVKLRPGGNGHGANGQGTNGHLPALAPPVNRLSLPFRPRVLVLSTAIGTGHLKAAEAIEQALRQTAPDAVVRRVEVLDHASLAFRRCYAGMYLDLISLAPQVLGFFYNLMDKFRPLQFNFWDRLRVSLERMSMRPFIQLLKTGDWDLAINTHFLSAEIVASLRREGKVGFPQVQVTTDFETHRLWINQPCEHYFTATEEGARYLQCYGVPAGDISVTGIPVAPVFCDARARAASLARQGLVGDRPVVLQLAGGLGVGPIAEQYRALLEVEAPVELVAVAGHNSRAQKALAEIPVPARHRTRILGFTDQMDELMALADLVVSKPGGLTTAEALARGTPLVIVNPVPGQEERNSDFLLENGAAIKVNHLPTLALKVTALLRDPARLARMKANARRLGRPRAAFEVVEKSLALLRQLRAAGQ